jgi:hypothetical protein
MKTIDVLEQIVRYSILGALLLTACSAGIVLSTTNPPLPTQEGSTTIPASPANQNTASAPSLPAAPEGSSPTGETGINGGKPLPKGSGGITGPAGGSGGLTGIGGLDSSDTVLQWHREGGIAGMCSDIILNLAGQITSISCKNGAVQVLGQLDTEQQKTVNTWVEQYQSFNYETKDPATADAIKTTLLFQGKGSQEASQAIYDEMMKFLNEAVVKLRK